MSLDSLKESKCKPLGDENSDIFKIVCLRENAKQYSSHQEANEKLQKQIMLAIETLE